MRVTVYTGEMSSCFFSSTPILPRTVKIVGRPANGFSAGTAFGGGGGSRRGIQPFVDFLRTPKEHPVGTFFARMDTAIMGRKTLEAGLRMTGGKLPKTPMKMYVMSRTAEPGERVKGG